MDKRVTELEREYREGNPNALSAMYQLLYEMAYKIINNMAGDNRGLANELTADARQTKAHDAATYIIEQYIKRPDFCMKSPAAYLYKRAQWELYGARQKKANQIVSYMGELPEIANGHMAYRYIVTNIDTGSLESYGSAGELYQNPKYKGLRKKRLAECIRTGRKWKNYIFEILEVME